MTIENVESIQERRNAGRDVAVEASFKEHIPDGTTGPCSNHVGGTLYRLCELVYEREFDLAVRNAFAERTGPNIHDLRAALNAVSSAAHRDASAYRDEVLQAAIAAKQEQAA